MNIWNKTLHSLLVSKDEASVRLAFVLVDDVQALCHWWFMSEEECHQCGLEELKIENNYIDRVMDDYQEETIQACNLSENLIYIKALYEKNNTVE